MTRTRRNFFLLAGGAIAAAQDRSMISHAVRPEDLEMPLSGFADYITPFDHFFVRTHVYVPTVNISDWRLKVEGAVATPITLTMDDLRRMPSVEMVAVVECAGNGRSFYDPPVPGLQWSNGSVGNARWRGVRLAEVLKRAGVREPAVEVLFDGADQPIGTMQDFRRSITIKKALDPNTLLAYEMNGEPIPLKHGFPLRVCAAGWASDSWVKWLTSITVLDKPWDGFWMKNAYRKPDHAVAPGTSLTPEQMVPVTSLRVKTVIAAPTSNWARPGEPVRIAGVAWSGDAGPVTSVDVSTDAARTWKPAELHRDQKTQFGWRQWEFSWTPEQEAYYTIMARAHDAAGNTQPFAQEWNPSGYGWNVVPEIHISVQKEQPPAQPSPVSSEPAQPPPTFRGSCLACHQDDVMSQQHLTRAQWDREITKMTNWGAQVKPEDRDSLLNYLAARFGR
jgi:sulfite oxidase